VTGRKINKPNTEQMAKIEFDHSFVFCSFRSLRVPNIAAFYISLANFHVKQELVEKAIEEYNAALQEDANVLSAHMGLGMIYDAQQKYDKAKEDYRKALKIHANVAPAANNLAYLFAETGENIDVTLLC
jgi:Tfp pilus assembly protein PilF